MTDRDRRVAGIEKGLEQSGEPVVANPKRELPSLAILVKQRGSLPEPELIRIFTQVLEDLELAHSQTMLHRDITSARIVRDGTSWKLTDYAVGGVGNVRYMSPERCQGKSMDGRSDTYSLGICLYEAATGKLPFDGPLKFEIIQAQTNTPPAPPRSVRPEVSLDLERIIIRALSKSPAGRFQTAPEFRQALGTLAKRHRIPTSAAPTAAQVEFEPERELPPLPEAEAGPKPMDYAPARRVKPGLVVLLVMAALVAVAAFVLLPKMMGAKLPNVVGLDREAAKERLAALGQGVAVVDTDAAGDAGKVVAQDPAAGTKFDRNGAVRLSVSTGNLTVPEVAGATLEEAKQRIAAAGLAVGRVDEVFSDHYASGMVTGSSPKSGSALKSGTEVVLTLAAGRASCPQCGAQRQAGGRFCTKCGYKY